MVTPQPNLNPEAMPWARDKDQRLLKLEADAARRAQGEVNSNSQQNSTLGQLGQQLVILQGLVDDLTQQVADAIAANSYTASQIDSKIANPVDVNASGTVTSAGAVISPGSKAATAVVGYSNMYIDVNGMMAGNTSSRRFKQDITPVQTNYAGFLGLTVYKFRYIEAVETLGDDAAWEYGLIAEEAVEVVPWACFYEADGTTVRGINYDRLVVALLDIAKDHEARIKALEG